MNTTILEMERELLKARHQVKMLDNLISSIEIDFSAVKLGLSVEDKGINMVEPYLVMCNLENRVDIFGLYIGMWKKIEIYMNEQFHRLERKNDELTVILKKYHGIPIDEPVKESDIERELMGF